MKTQKRIAALAALILLATPSVSAFANSTQKADPFTDGGLAGKSAPYGEQGNSVSRIRSRRRLIAATTLALRVRSRWSSGARIAAGSA